MARIKGKRPKVRFNFNIYADQLQSLRKLEELDDVEISKRLRTWIDIQLAQLNLEQSQSQIVEEGFDII